jgi:hypothetical protein
MTTYTTAQLQQMAAQAALAKGVPPTFFQQLIQDESGYNTGATGPSTSSGNAQGIAQFMPGTAAQFGINPNDPTQALPAAASYLASLFQKTGSWLGAANAYGTTTGIGAKNIPNLTNALSLDNIFGGNPSGTSSSPAASTAPATGSTGTTSSGNSIVTFLQNLFSINTAERSTAVVLGTILALIAITILIMQNRTVQQVSSQVGSATRKLGSLAAAT